MDDISKLYFECHVTVEPVFDESRERLSKIAESNGFKLAKLLMKKREEDTEERSKHDTFMTGHSKSYSDLEDRMLRLIADVTAQGYKVWRYKIEDTIIDSRHEDIHGVLSPVVGK